MQLIATAAGYTCYKPDDTGDGIDLVICRTQHDGRSPRPPNLELQVKTIRSPELVDGELVYDLEIRHYNCLRSDGPTRRYLVLVTVPGDDPDSWHGHEEKASIFREAAFYVDLLGRGDTENKNTIRVKAPVAHRLVPAVVRELMRRAEIDYGRRFRRGGVECND
ncbi:MAG: DUF4365 domain-containing protein [Frankia sp.]|nr:DUF4365 domain-containing protein [Frankia sp.]